MGPTCLSITWTSLAGPCPAPALLPPHRCFSGGRSPVPARGIPRLRLQMRARGSGTTSGAHSGAGRTGARKARAPAVTGHSAGSPTPRRRGSGYLLSSLSNWWAARPAAFASAPRPLGAVLPPRAPKWLTRGSGSRRRRLHRHRRARAPRALLSRGGWRGGNTRLAAPRTCLTDRRTPGSRLVQARARARARATSAPGVGPGGGTARPRAGWGSWRARPAPEGCGEIFRVAGGPSSFPPCSWSCWGFTPAREASGQVGCGRAAAAAAAAPSRSVATLGGASHELKPRRDEPHEGSGGAAAASAGTERRSGRGAFPSGSRLPPLLPASRWDTSQPRDFDTKAAFLRGARRAAAASEAPHLKAAQTAELVLCLSSAPHAEPTPCSWLWSWNPWANGLRVK